MILDTSIRQIASHYCRLLWSSGMIKQAATIILTVQIDGQDHVVLNAGDPRWRLDGEGKFRGIEAIKNGVIQSLPLTDLKFIGGGVDAGEALKQAALRELAEEAGPELTQLITEEDLLPVYTMTRPSEVPDEGNMTVAYFHVHL